VIITHSKRSFDTTMQSLKDSIEQRGLTLFAQIDHSGGARAAGMELAEEQLLVFGSPRGGTPLMQSDPRVGIELPLRMLLWQEGERTLLGYEDPRALGERFSLGDVEQALAQLSTLLATLAEEAASGETQGIT
jgi:uncharacterized protein (DUF302 family)